MAQEPRRPTITGLGRRTILTAFSWSLAFLAVSRVSSLIAVPVILGHYGAALYAVWVVAGALIMAQGLVDLGVGAAVIRFVAAAGPRPGRDAVRVIATRAGVFYLGLSLVVGVPMWIWAFDLAGAVSGIHGDLQIEGAVVIRYAAVAFGVTNVIVVLGSLLQGLGRVTASFRAQTLGWMAYVPALATGSELGYGTDALGGAWLVAFGLQALLLLAAFVRVLRRLPGRGGSVPSTRALLNFGGRWQVSAWADFATFALPRLIGGLVLSSQDLVSIDVAMRAAQAVVAPIFGFSPVVLPTAASAWATEGIAGVRRLVERWLLPGFVVVALGTALLAPFEPAAISAWTGRPSDAASWFVDLLILIGVVAHASTSLMSSAMLAIGDIGSVVVYKYRQLLVAAVGLIPAAYLGEEAVAVVLAAALLVPAVAFNWRAGREIGVVLPKPHDPFWRRLAFATACVGGATLFAVLLSHPAGSPWVTLAIAVPLGGILMIALAVWCRRAIPLTGRPDVTAAGSGSGEMPATNLR